MLGQVAVGGAQVVDVAGAGLHARGVLHQAGLLARRQGRRLEPQQLGDVLLQATRQVSLFYLLFFQSYWLTGQEARTPDATLTSCSCVVTMPSRMKRPKSSKKALYFSGSFLLWSSRKRITLCCRTSRSFLRPRYKDTDQYLFCWDRLYLL